jgi:DnaJ-class molecular chaperone
MNAQKTDWADRFRTGLNGILDRIADFEEQGGFGGVLQRGVEKMRLEQERMRDEVGPLAYHAKVRQAYARLEVPYGAGLDIVRPAYRRLMRKYHPDRHSGDTQREKLATEIAQKLTAAYDLLVDYLER